MQRQVAHALLTRPPLSYLNASRRIDSNSSVRLECVMHAASVHPEPGSNSRKIYIISKDQASAITFSSYSFLASFTLLSIYNSLTRSSIFALRNALYFSLVVQFSMTVRYPLPRGQLDYYITSLSSCQYLFSKFFEISLKNF